MERSLVLVKPDGVQRALVGEVISRLERRGLRLVAAKFMQVSRELAETHYAIHKGKPFYDGLIAYIISAPVMAMVWEGPTRSLPSDRRWDPPVRQRPHPVRCATILHSKLAATLPMLQIRLRMVRRKSLSGSSPKSWWTGKGKWIAGCLRNREVESRIDKSSRRV